MSRSERYIAPSAKELERWRQAAAAAKQFDREREELLRAALKKRKKADLVEVALRLAQQDKASQWLLEQEVGLDKPVNLLVHDIEVAIEIATRVDERGSTTTSRSISVPTTRCSVACRSWSGRRESNKPRLWP